MAIPIFGLFGVFWTAIAEWITYVNYRNGVSDKEEYEQKSKEILEEL